MWTIKKIYFTLGTNITPLGLQFDVTNSLYT